MQENSGLTNVHPVDYIIDVVNLERTRVGDNNISRYEMIIPNEKPQLNVPNQNATETSNNQK